MKKTLIIAAALAITGLSAYSQGVVTMTTGLHNIWNNTTGTGVNSSTGINAALLFAPTSVGLATLPNVGDSQTTGAPNYTTAAAWTDISAAITAGYFYVQGTASIAAVGAGTGTGMNYNGGISWTSQNLDPSATPTTYDAYMIAWAGGYATPALAASNGAYVGWSQEFSYTCATSGAAAPMGTSQLGAFGVGGSTVPEPGTLALAALGGASLLMFRRKNK
jgi:hypothetical protein